MHGVLDVSPEWQRDHANWEPHYWEAPIEQAFLKHIRPSTEKKEDGKVHSYPCMFGDELDPEGEYLVASI